jgi:hypothetical protein
MNYSSLNTLADDLCDIRDSIADEDAQATVQGVLMGVCDILVSMEGGEDVPAERAERILSSAHRIRGNAVRWLTAA